MVTELRTGSTMRQRIGKFFPIVMIAIWVQIFAPIGSYWAMAAAMDPLDSAPICAPSKSTNAEKSQPDGQQPSNMDCCSLCVAAHSGSAPLQFAEPGAVTIMWR